MNNDLYYLVLDLEATCCDQGSIPREETEIIEIGAVMVTSDDWQLVSEFATFVKPQRHPSLTAFCTNLTSITQADVEHAPLLAEAFVDLEHWHESHSRCLFCSWGDYDRKQIERECAQLDLSYPLPRDHLNLKREFSSQQNYPRRMGMAGALLVAGLTLEGTHHRGIDDARNIARLLPYALGRATIPKRE